MAVLAKSYGKFSEFQLYRSYEFVHAIDSHRRPIYLATYKFIVSSVRCEYLATGICSYLFIYVRFARRIAEQIANWPLGARRMCSVSYSYYVNETLHVGHGYVTYS